MLRLLFPGKDPVPIVQEAGWNSGAGLNSMEKLAPTRIGSPDCSAHSEALPGWRYGFVLLESCGILIIRDVF
jgi:hypothetical protein